MDITQPNATTIHIDGFPDAVKVIKVEGPLALQLADLALHMADLISADNYLDGINTIGHDRVREGLIVAALVKYCKCFGQSKARSSVRLDAAVIYAGDTSALNAYDYYKDLRNKHVVHDENSFSQATVGAALSPREAPGKIQRVFSFAINTRLAEESHFGNLKLLIQQASNWVQSEIQRLSCDVTVELEAEAYEDLLAREQLTMHGIDVTKVKAKR